MSMFSMGSKLIADVMQQNCSVAVIYARGTRRINLQAVMGASFAQRDSDDAEVRLESTTQAWLIRSEDLVLDGRQIEPQAGDQVVITRGSFEQTYIVATEGEQAWRYATPDRHQIRLQTQLLTSRSVL